jgi:hypothetical protein
MDVMQQAKLIVCERSGRWATALRRSLVDNDAEDSEIDIVETRSVSDCRDELVAAPESLVVLEISPANTAAAVELLTYIDRWFAISRSLVVADRAHSSFEPIAREAGAIDFLTSPRQLPRTVGATRRHFARTSTRPKSLAVGLLERFVSWS